MKIIKPRIDILPSEQSGLWPLLGPTKDLHFTLYGGTALALRLGHRISVDFDFFSHLSFSGDENFLFDKLPFLQSAKIIQRSVNTLSFLTRDGVKLSFFGNISYGRVGEVCITDDNIMFIASTADLMATKLAALVQRVEVKDYIDIASIIQSGYSLQDGLCGLYTLFGQSVPAMEVARTLTFFQGGDLDKLPEQSKQILIEAVDGLDMRMIKPLSVLSCSLNC